jgi:hypothetical protein
MPVTTVPSEARSSLVRLFAAHRRDRALIDCVLEGHVGQAFADKLALPSAARLDCGPFAALGGDPASPSARDLVRHAPIDWITPETDAWRAFLEAEFAGRIRRIRFAELSAAGLDAGQLEARSRALPRGYELARLNAELAEALIRDLGKQWLLDSYASMDDFLNRGIGYVVLHEGQVVASAASAVSSSRAIDIDIEVTPAHRRIARHRTPMARIERHLRPSGPEARLHRRRDLRNVRDPADSGGLASRRPRRPLQSPVGLTPIGNADDKDDHDVIEDGVDDDVVPSHMDTTQMALAL